MQDVERYDATRSLGHVSLKDAPATVLDAPEESLAGAWYLAQSLIAAESLGSVEVALDVSVQYAKERHTFGRAIGSYQAIKHALTEVLRQLENGRSLLYYAGWARNGAPDEFALAASAARSVAGRALDEAARTMISVHGGIGATWEHDAPLYFRRAQLSRRLIGGTGQATDRVAGELLLQADAAWPPAAAPRRPLRLAPAGGRARRERRQHRRAIRFVHGLNQCGRGRAADAEAVLGPADRTGEHLVGVDYAGFVVAVVVVGGNPGGVAQRMACAVGRQQVRRGHDRVEVVVDRWMRRCHVVVGGGTRAVEV